MRKKIIAGNWKLNPKTKKEAIDLASGVASSLQGKLNTQIQVIFCVPAIYLEAVSQTVKDTEIKIGAENCYFEDNGAFTGEISPAMLKDIGAEYVILGHSERRTLFGEDNQLVAKKAQAVVNHNLIPIVCVGETNEQRENGTTDQVVMSQVEESLKGFKATGENLIIAYEPVWAIGTGKTCSSEEANRVCGLIRSKLGELFGKEVADKTAIQYGGSVKSSTVAEQMQQSDIDGALVGGASLKVDEFSQLVLNAL